MEIKTSPLQDEAGGFFVTSKCINGNKMKNIYKLLLLLGLLCPTLQLFAQEEASEIQKAERTNPFTVDFSAKIKSRHVWYGWLSCNSWNIQPNLTVSAYGAFFNAWAYTALDHTLSSEIDLTLGYTLGPVSLMYIDMFYPTENKKDALPHTMGTSGYMRFFRYNKEDDGAIHQQMALLQFAGVHQFPIECTVGIFTYGDPLYHTEQDPITGKEVAVRDKYEAFSTIVNFGYSHSLKSGQKLTYELGFTPFKGSGFFADGFNVVNAKFAVSQPLRITDTFALQLNGELILNPYRENLYFVVALGF